MKVNVEALYYACIDRIDDENIEVAEEYLIGCVTFLHRQTYGRADRDRVAEDFGLDRGIEKYETELAVISKMSESGLATLIASSLDFSKELDRLEKTYAHIRNSVYDETEADHQVTKFDKAIAILSEMKKCVKDKEFRRNILEKEPTPSLFGDELVDGEK